MVDRSEKTLEELSAELQELVDQFPEEEVTAHLRRSAPDSLRTIWHYLTGALDSPDDADRNP